MYTRMQSGSRHNKEHTNLLTYFQHTLLDKSPCPLVDTSSCQSHLKTKSIKFFLVFIITSINHQVTMRNITQQVSQMFAALSEESEGWTYWPGGRGQLPAAVSYLSAETAHRLCYCYKIQITKTWTSSKWQQRTISHRHITAHTHAHTQSHIGAQAFKHTNA